MKAKLVLALASLLFLFSCNTLMEASDPYEQTKGAYTATKNSNGETTYVRETPRPGYFNPTPAPVIYPSPIIPPPPLEPVPRYKPSYSTNSGGDQSSAANIDSTGQSHVQTFLELARTEGNTHLGIHLGGNLSDALVARGGASMFYSEELFLGFDLSARAYLPTSTLKPFAGVGAYYGDTKKCSNTYSNGVPVERCDKKFLGAGYVELGAEYENFSIFWRDYNVTRAGLTVPTEAFWGIGLRF